MDLDIIRDAFTDDPETLLDALGVEYESKPGRLMVLCPFHDDHNMGSAYVRRGHLHCFACNTNADAFTITEKVRDCSFLAACDFVSKTYGIEVTAEKYSGSEFYLTRQEREALAFPVTSISLSKIRAMNEGIFKKIVLAQCAKKMAEYQQLDRLYGARDAEEAYILAEAEDVSAFTYAEIHRVLQQRQNVLSELQKRI